MDKRDVIVAAFACGGKMKCKKEAEKFSEAPLVINVPGGSVSGFVETAKMFRSKNSILNNFFASHNIKPRRVCLIGFSDGWSWITQILRAKKDVNRIDTIITLDSAHTPNLRAWNEFAKLAGKGGIKAPKLWMAHTQTKSPPNVKILKSINSNAREIIVPDYIKNAQIEKSPVSVYCKAEKPRYKLFHSDPLYSIEIIGNAVRFEYEGNTGQDHTYLAHYVQPRFWRWLKDIWNNPKNGVLW